MSLSELCAKGAGELTAMIRAREVTSREVIDAHLDRIAKVNPALNAVTVTLAGEARAASADHEPDPNYRVFWLVGERGGLRPGPRGRGRGPYGTLQWYAYALPTATARYVDQLDHPVGGGSSEPMAPDGTNADEPTEPPLALCTEGLSESTNGPGEDRTPNPLIKSAPDAPATVGHDQLSTYDRSTQRRGATDRGMGWSGVEW